MGKEIVMKIQIKYNANTYDLLGDNTEFYGFTKRQLELARYLMSEGIRPQQLENIEHNLKWAYEIVSTQIDEAYKKAINDIEMNFGSHQ